MAHPPPGACLLLDTLGCSKQHVRQGSHSTVISAPPTIALSLPSQLTTNHSKQQSTSAPEDEGAAAGGEEAQARPHRAHILMQHP